MGDDAEAGRQMLYAEHEGSSYRFSPHDVVTLGRGATVDLGDDPRLHRSLGQLHHGVDGWWLSNTGRTVPLHVVDEVNGSSTVVPAGCQTLLRSATHLVWARMGTNHLEVRLHQPGVPAPEAPPPAPVTGDATADAAAFPLNTEQRQLLAALCETRLRDPLSPLVLPANRDVAARLAWSTTKFNRKLDYLCERVARLGQPGLRSTQGRAAERRRHLAEWALANGVVGPADLSLLP